MVKIAVFAPMPSVSAATASIVNTGLRTNIRQAYRASISRDCQFMGTLSLDEANANALAATSATVRTSSAGHGGRTPGGGRAMTIAEGLLHRRAEPLPERRRIGVEQEPIDRPGDFHARPPRNSRRAAVTWLASRSTSARATAWPSVVNR